MPNEVLQVAAVIAAGIVATPKVDLDNPEEVAQKVVAIAKALINEANKN